MKNAIAEETCPKAVCCLTVTACCVSCGLHGFNNKTSPKRLDLCCYSFGGVKHPCPMPYPCPPDSCAAYVCCPCCCAWVFWSSFSHAMLWVPNNAYFEADNCDCNDDECKCDPCCACKCLADILT